ncbi:MAG: hypothetical protein Q8P31_00485 [Bacillota bacterium]|nr:hypothetical protein [Bacillota bacterium]
MNPAGVAVSAVVVLFLLSAPRGKNKYYPLGFGVFLGLLSSAYAAVNGEWMFYVLGVLALARGYWQHRRWQE